MSQRKTKQCARIAEAAGDVRKTPRKREKWEVWRKKKSSLLKTLNQFEKKLGPNPTCLSEEANKVRKKNTKCPLSEKLYIYKKHTI